MFFSVSKLSNQPIFYLLLSFGFAFLFTLIFLPLYIKWLKHSQLGQFVREEGPASHANKAKTPTTGGVIFALATIISPVLISLIRNKWDTVSLAVIALALICALIGLIDDAAKFANKDNRGLSASKRLLLELIFGGGFGCVLLALSPQANYLLLSLKAALHMGAGAFYILPAFAFILLCAFIVAATTNAINLHDGMDGLAAGTLFPVFLTLGLILLKVDHFSLATIALSCAGALSVFLLFNCYPAKVFMGDVGSLFLGGLLAGLVLSSGLTLWFIPLAALYILETLSVILQVSIFKLTKPYSPPNPLNKLSLALYKLTNRLPGEGKRIFRMAPLHHHFEAVWAEKGISEWQVVLVFWLIQLLICGIVLAAFFSF